MFQGNKPDTRQINNNNVHPHIIACGNSIKEISHYFIAVEKDLINVCIDSDSEITHLFIAHFEYFYRCRWTIHLPEHLTYTSSFIMR